MVTELDARRADQIPGQTLHLPQAGDWTLPAPGSLESYQDDSWFQTSYARAVLDLFEAQDASERQAAELALAICLISRNYRLEPVGYREILGARATDEREEIRHQIHDIAEAHAQSFQHRLQDHDDSGEHIGSDHHWYDGVASILGHRSEFTRHHA